LRVPTSDLHAANACWSLFLLSTYLVVAEAASFDKKELCRSDTVSKTLRSGKEGDIQYAIQGIVGELAELMKELDPTIPPDNIETIRAEAGDVLWYLILLISSQKEVFKNFKFRSISSSETYFEIRKMFHWIDKLCKYSNQHDLDDMGVWRPRENCINITVYLYEILDFLLCCTDLSLFELIWYNQTKLEKRLKIESEPDAEVD
jgi:hypothetical protein